MQAMVCNRVELSNVFSVSNNSSPQNDTMNSLTSRRFSDPVQFRRHRQLVQSHSVHPETSVGQAMAQQWPVAAPKSSDSNNNNNNNNASDHTPSLSSSRLAKPSLSALSEEDAAQMIALSNNPTATELCEAGGDTQRESDAIPMQSNCIDDFHNESELSTVSSPTAASSRSCEATSQQDDDCHSFATSDMHVALGDASSFGLSNRPQRSSSAPPQPALIQSRPSSSSCRIQRRVSFSDTVNVHQTYTPTDYDRTMVALGSLTPAKIEEIRREIILFKYYEMAVHPSSVQHNAYMI
ncbi:hypothetical protein CAOG_01962 [Capsaspora owczarzaki ATCC 30864]|uniref:Uncharacterized protein n=1 Tax=Capsaspora owczarzaki (strain ATCC 30864) TaxID=595528 RepID=A0A0D2X1F0_CAPO3|nr:hypothetical protein CAOG_01962 [Capsaspora owczarzaki ATCC 30864]KJE90694.1 hypothetical protein CAOG_001962 [Capsaspora owczarzaki ATCC 30864]|eukprot:XP_004364830.2 hypothetical protein CAOG_01962 [Capsaspora owczarzaki ATCC 30864]